METLTTTLTDSIKFEKHLAGHEKALALMGMIKKAHVTHKSLLDKEMFKRSIGLEEEAQKARNKAVARLAAYYRLWSYYRKVTKNLYHG